MTTPPAWCINWDAYELPQLWEMLADEDRKEAWDQVQVWFRLRSAVEAQRQRLHACRQALQERWPAESSPASAAFISYLDHLIASMTETVTSAESTAHGLAGILHTLATAKAEMEPLRDEWLFADTDLVPRWMNGEEDAINTKARKIMSTAEQAVADYTAMIKIPPSYKLGTQIDPGVPESPTGLPSADLPGSSPVQSTSFQAPADRSIPPFPHDPPEPLPGIDPLLPDAGPVLSDAPAPVMAPSPITQAPGVPVGAGTGLPTTGGIPVAPVAGPLPGYGVIGEPRPPTSADGRVGGPGGSMPMVPATPQPISRQGRPATNGLSGGRPPSASAPVMAPGVGPNGTPGAASRTASYRTPDGHLVTMSGRRADERPGSDPDDPWAVDRGVTPLIAPPAPHPYDPGPGIIGMGR